MAVAPREGESEIRYGRRAGQGELVGPRSLRWGFGFSPKTSGETLKYIKQERGMIICNDQDALWVLCAEQRGKGKGDVTV